MMMSCPIQPPASLFCSPAAVVGGGADLLDVGAPLANLHPLFLAAKQTTNGTGESGGCQKQQTTTPGAWFFQQSPAEGSDGSINALGLPDSGGLSAGVPASLSPPPGSLAHQQLLARFGPRHTTESVEVPSSEHVAEIVGRQGCKIKALRAKTNTYIKTPVRGEEPVFVVTGRHEDVLEAKREIECAAEHFTQIRASRRHSQGGCPAPGHVTAYVRVPLRVVGLVVGPKGNTIKRIQQDTHTYIITPSREREPIFEVTGLPQNVEAARREIEQHIYQRTGNMPITDSSASIANYDLHVRQGSWSWSQSNGAAALQAQHAALHANALNRPNYGALAVTSTARQLQHQHQAVPQLQPSPYQPHFHHQQYINKGPSLGDLNGGFCTQQQDIVQHGTGTKLFGSAAASPPPFGPIGGALPLGTSASSNNLHAMLGALDLDGGAQQGQHQGQPSSAADFKLDSSSMLLLRSSSNGIAAAQSRGGPSAFSPWRISSGTVDAVPQNDFLDLLTSTSPSPLFSASSGGGGGCHSSSYSGGSCGGIGGFACGELSSVNSTSRDEGLGDSPTNSFGRPNGTDPYQHLMTIWADVCDGRAAGEVGKSAGEAAEVKAKTEEKGGGELTTAG